MTRIIHPEALEFIDGSQPVGCPKQGIRGIIASLDRNFRARHNALNPLEMRHGQSCVAGASSLFTLLIDGGRKLFKKTAPLAFCIRAGFVSQWQSLAPRTFSEPKLVVFLSNTRGHQPRGVTLGNPRPLPGQCRAGVLQGTLEFAQVVPTVGKVGTEPRQTFIRAKRLCILLLFVAQDEQRRSSALS